MITTIDKILDPNIPQPRFPKWSNRIIYSSIVPYLNHWGIYVLRINDMYCIYIYSGGLWMSKLSWTCSSCQEPTSQTIRFDLQTEGGICEGFRVRLDLARRDVLVQDENGTTTNVHVCYRMLMYDIYIYSRSLYCLVTTTPVPWFRGWYWYLYSEYV